MPIPPLLGIDPDKLFEQSSIHEIEELQKKLQNEIERKREELRTMVGERYRDFIEAADTISLMKNLSEKVIDDVNNMKTATVELQERQVSGFKIEYHKSDRHNDHWNTVAPQIGILADVAEYIWEALDKAEYTQASLLYLMARYIKTSLEINPSLEIDKAFPVVSCQWSSLEHFKETILQGAEEMLKTHHNSETTCNGLLSIALLKGLTTSKLLEKYLSLRSHALEQALDCQCSLDSSAIKQRLCHSYSLLIHSIVAIYTCFLDSLELNKGLLWKELQHLVGPHSSTTLEFLAQNIDVPIFLLPSAIKDFRPTLDTPLEHLSEKEVQDAISSWLVWVRQFVKDKGGQLLQKLSSLRNLHGLRDAPTIMSEEWPLVAQRLLAQPTLDLWNDLYRTLITVRAQQLVSVHWEAALRTLQQQIDVAVQAVSSDNKLTEVDLQWYIWKESTNDLDDLKIAKGLLLKAKGLTPRVAELCAALEHKVSSLLSDLASLCPEQEVDPALLVISQTLKTHQQTVCANLLLKLVHFVKEVLNKTTSEAAAMLLAKFLQSVPELCPSLNKCLSSFDTKSGSWQENLVLLQSECFNAYKIWHDLASPRILRCTTEMLTAATPSLHSIPQWEEIAIEEEGETGEKLQSVLKVPCSASLNIQNVLHQLASLIGHSAVPKQISEQVTESVLAIILDLYGKNDETGLSQTQYLQMLLDVRYIAQLFNINNKSLKTKYQDTVGNLESKIDPFDLNVFSPYISSNVKIAVSQTQSLLGVLVTVGGLAVSSHRSEEPCLLALSSSSTTWFPLLHITTPRVSHAPTKPKGKKFATIPSTAANTSTEAVSKQSSSSFFGVMATDWFG